MKRVLLGLLALITMTGCAHAAGENFYQNAYFHTNVYLHDATNTPLHMRIPTGAVATVNGGIFSPQGAVEFDGAMTIAGPVLLATNGMMITYKPDVSGLGTGVTFNANGEIVLRRWVTGTGWTNLTINPTNTLPLPIIPINPNMALSSTGWLGTNATWVAIGLKADPGFSEYSYAVALGSYSYSGPDEYGVAVGYAANGKSSGVAMGGWADGSQAGTALGYQTHATNYAVAIGATANAAEFNVSIGKGSSALGSGRIAIGRDMQNTNDNTALLRGTLYLDGGTNRVYYRPVAGTGGWYPATLLVITNSYTGGVMRLSTDNGNTFKYE